MSEVNARTIISESIDTQRLSLIVEHSKDPITQAVNLMTDSRPIVLLDLDGVVNPLHYHPHDPVAVREDYAQWEVASSLPERLTRTQGLAQVVWASAWESECNMINDFFNLAHFPWVEWTEEPYLGALHLPRIDTWKFPTILRLLESTLKSRPVLWVDDELGADVVEFSPQIPNLHILQVDGSIGLTEDNWATIDRFCLTNQ